MGLAARLWSDNADLAEAALHHPFVRGLADGSLPEDVFAGYVAQDAFFLEAFVRAYAMALAHSPDHFGIDAFTDLIVGVRDELRLHSDYARRWRIDLSTVDPNPATLAYTGFLGSSAATGDVGLICAAMTPCLRLYAYLGQSLAAQPHATTYQEWIATYADPGFSGLADRLEQLLDRYGTDEVAAAYRSAMEFEIAFFSAAVLG